LDLALDGEQRTLDMTDFGINATDTIEELIVKRLNFLKIVPSEVIDTIDALLVVKRSEQSVLDREHRRLDLRQRELDIKNNELELHMKRKAEGLSAVTGEAQELTHTHTHKPFLFILLLLNKLFPSSATRTQAKMNHVQTASTFLDLFSACLEWPSSSPSSTSSSPSSLQVASEPRKAKTFFLDSSCPKGETFSMRSSAASRTSAFSCSADSSTLASRELEEISLVASATAKLRNRRNKSTSPSSAPV